MFFIPKDTLIEKIDIILKMSSLFEARKEQYCITSINQNEHIRRESQRVAIWDLHIQHLCGERYFGDMQKDGTILYTEPPHTVDDERIIRPADPYVFRVRDEYHQLFIDHYYDGEDYTSPESDGSAESDGSLEADEISSE